MAATQVANPCALFMKRDCRSARLRLTSNTWNLLCPFGRSQEVLKCRDAPLAVSNFPATSGSSAFLSVFLWNFDVPHNWSMPRNGWVRKNSYCLRSKLSDPVFECVLWYYLQGTPSCDTAKRTKEILGTALSEKTVGRYYKRIGDALIKRVLTGFIDVMRPEWSAVKKEHPERYEFAREAAIRTVASRFHRSVYRAMHAALCRKNDVGRKHIGHGISALLRSQEWNPG